ncbi:O-antigen ligase family protein [Pseudidiomarina aestuarii]|nr:O-antigen ligase family protein [Pseudidiomarina aestuarii]
MIQLTRQQLAFIAIVLLTYAAVWVDTLFGIFSFLGLGALKVSLLYRLTITVIILVMMFVYQNILSWYMKFMLLGWAFLLWVLTWPAGDLELVTQVNHILRLLYPFGLGLLTYKLLSTFPQFSQRTLAGIGHYGWVVGVFVVFSAFTGLGLESYGEHAFGIKSFYFAGNDTGLAALLALCCLFCVLYYQPSPLRFGAILFCLSGLILMGTKAGWAGALLVSFSYLIVFLFFKKTQGSVGVMLKGATVIGMVAVVAFAASIIVPNYDRISYQIEQFQALAAGQNPRAELIQAADRHFTDYPDQLALIGNGDRFDAGVGERYFVTFNNTLGTTTNKLVEQDWYDLRGHYGMPFALFVTLGHVAFLLLAGWQWITRPRVISFTLLLALSLFMGHAMLAGHAFLSGQSGGLAGVLYGLLLARTRRSG